MQKHILLIKNITLFAGIIEIGVGLLHFFMPYFIYQSDGFEYLSEIELNYVTLVTFAVGILLVAFGAVTILFSLHIESVKKILLQYLIIKIVLWTLRVVFEIIYPLELNIFYVNPFTTIVFPGLVLELLLFIVSFILIKISIKEAIK